MPWDLAALHDSGRGGPGAQTARRPCSASNATTAGCWGDGVGRTTDVVEHSIDVIGGQLGEAIGLASRQRRFTIDNEVALARGARVS
jgi:hypothetical protein